jgi:hypothetical protein
MEINDRRDNVTTDQILRYGAEKIPRRSEFTDWYENNGIIHVLPSYLGKLSQKKSKNITFSHSSCHRDLL